MTRTQINRKALAPSTDGCLAIIEILSQNPAGLTLSDIHHRLGISKNMTFRILNDLSSRGYTHKTASKTYSLGSKLLELSVPQAAGRNLVDEAAPEIKALRDKTGESVGLLVPCGNEAVLIYFQPSRQPIRTIYDVGVKIPLYCNAPGKVFLAFGDPKERASRLKHQALKRYTPRTITDPARLEAQLETARRNGYTVDRAEEIEGSYCVAAPVYDHDNRLVAAVVVTGPQERIREDKFPFFGKMAAAAADRITTRLKQ
jgi:IclR family acetate operon transcriptional repressor